MAAFSGAAETPASNASVHNEASRGLTNLDNAIENILTVQSDVGSHAPRRNAV